MKKNVITKLILYLIVIIIFGLIFYKIINLIKRPTNTFLVENGKLSDEQSMQGYVLREEEVIKGENYKNGMQKIKLEGEKVAKGEAIFRYYTSGEEELVNKISQLDVKIAEALEQEQNSIFGADIKTIENDIQTKISNVYKLNDIQKIKEYKQDINNSINKKAKIAGELSPAGSYLKGLIEQRSNYENELNSGSEYLSSNKSGIVSYRIDGLEEKLTTDNFGYLSKSLLEDLNLKTGQIVSTSEESGKIINNYECYIACILDNVLIESEDTEQKEDTPDKHLIKLDDTLKIRLSNNQEINATIKYISEENENEKLIVFKIDRCVEELINYRKISFDIIWWSANGLKVPNEAIKNENGLDYVVRQRNGYSDKIYIKVLKQNENYSIIENYTKDELLETNLEETDVYRQAILKISIYDEIAI